MKVLYVITKGNFGGAQRYVFELAVEAKRRGHDVTVVYGEPGVLIKKLAGAYIRTISLSTLQRNINPLKEIGSFIRLVSLIHSLHPDVVHLNSAKAGGLGALAARVMAVPRIVFTVHGWPFNEERLWVDNMVRALLQWLTVMLTHVSIVVAESDKKQVAHWPFVQKKIVCIHNGVGTIDFLERSTSRANLLSTHVEKFWIGAHTENKNKGIDFLLKAYARAREKLSSAIIVLFGTGPEESNLKRLTRELGIEDKVFFLGFLDNARAYLKAFDVYTIPSRKEGLPYSLLEAGAAGLPVVASRVGGIPEAVTDTQSGFLTAPGDVVLLSARLAELIESEPLREKFGQALRAKVEKEFSLSHVFEKTFALYSHP